MDADPDSDLQRSSEFQTHMQKLPVYMVSPHLPHDPDEVVVTESEKEEEIVIELKVAPTDMGKVIGKQGRIAKAIRSVVKAASSKMDKKVIVEIQ